MSRFYIISMLVHIAFVGIFVYASHPAPTPVPMYNVYKVSIAPLPQPKVIPVESPEKEEAQAEIKKPVSKEKAPPQEKSAPVQQKKTAKADNKRLTQGLPDITPQIYTGSGRGFTYSYYLNILLDKINRNWDNPFKGKDVVLKSVVYFEVDTKGTIYSVRLEENSGDDVYDEATMRAVTLTKKLPPLPQEFSTDYLKVHLEFLTAQ